MASSINFKDALQDLVELDFDVLEAYEAAICKIKNDTYKRKLEEFKKDYDRHIQELSHVLRAYGESPPAYPSIGKQWLPKSSSFLTHLMGDNTILSAMRVNEEDTAAAYEQVNNHPDYWPEVKPILQRALAEEEEHAQWFKETLQQKIA